MNATTRIFAMLVWLGALAVAGSAVLTLTAARVGEHKSSTYGNAYTQFQNSWGGEISIRPPQFGLLRTYTVSEYNKDSKKYEDVKKSERIPLIPKSIKIDSIVSYGEQERDLLIFNAFEAQNTETHVVANATDYSGELFMKVTKPDNANLLYDYRIMLPSQNDLVIRPIMDKEFLLFVAYLVRFFGIIPTFGISILLTAAMFFLYCPNVFGWRFASRVAGVYLFLLTVVFSLIFMMPIFRGLLFVILVFLVFMSIMSFISRLDISKWPIMSQGAPVKAGD